MKGVTYLVLGFTVLLAGCASSPPSASILAPSSPQVVSTVLEPAEPGYIPEPPRVVVKEPRVVESNQNRALDQLVDLAVGYLSERDYPRAVTTAERAMSIDRYDPRVYLLLAQSHRLSGNLALSRQYAARGLAISQAGTATARALESLK
jgi:hypothetical protein